MVGFFCNTNFMVFHFVYHIYLHIVYHSFTYTFNSNISVKPYSLRISVSTSFFPLLPSHPWNPHSIRGWQHCLSSSILCLQTSSTSIKRLGNRVLNHLALQTCNNCSPLSVSVTLFMSLMVSSEVHLKEHWLSSPWSTHQSRFFCAHQLSYSF